MHTNVDALFSGLWQDYVKITPSADKIHDLLGDKSGQSDIVNDHIALRTFNLPKVGIDKLAQHLLNLGYEAKGDYDFEAKKLSAKHFEHSDLTKPKVFISELRVEEMPEKVQNIIHKMIDQMPEDAVNQTDFLYSGTHWQVSSQDYKTLLEHSEYAAWMSAWGYRANHFTVSVNHLKNVKSLEEVNQILKNAGYKLNTSGGEIKGGKDVCLAQSSTMADHAVAKFSDTELTIPSCFYEFAERFNLPSGELYQGFVAASADKIFESTNAK
ncbi:DUF1338 domain-containing protein [Glaciecola sp. 1036]|uniref:DUF1338 domain-containing protein n=1 Tax=Alteromonadaceae TaxID=72275 RepID=UPI003D07CC1E